MVLQKKVRSSFGSSPAIKFITSLSFELTLDWCPGDTVEKGQIGAVMFIEAIIRLYVIAGEQIYCLYSDIILKYLYVRY